MLNKKKSLYTIGHSIRTYPEFLDLLLTHKIKNIVDVRTMPKSRRAPWSSSKALQKTLIKENIDYLHMPILGGLRKPLKNSINSGLTNLSFRGYADYMQTEEFEHGLQQLMILIKKSKGRLAILCAEALPWKCHRFLISDAIVARKIPVYHIVNNKNLKAHSINPLAIINKYGKNRKIAYLG